MWCAVRVKPYQEAQNQFVQSSEPGVIRKRYVSDGDFVKKGSSYYLILTR